MSPLRRFANQESAIHHPVPIPTDIFKLIDENRKTIIVQPGVKLVVLEPIVELVVLDITVSSLTVKL